jgi:3-dehydroquinate synthetase
MGMVVAGRVAAAMGLCQPDLPPRIEAVLHAFGLPTQVPPFQPEVVWEAMALDKKKRGSRLRFVLPRALGDVIITEEVTQETVLAVLGELNT